MADSLLKTVEIDGVAYMAVMSTNGACVGCAAYENPALCEALTDQKDPVCLVYPDGIYARAPHRWLEGTEPRCVGARSFAIGADVCPQRHECERFLNLARPVPTNPTYLEMWLCTPEHSAFLPVETPETIGEVPV